ncbi:ABC transporter permease [Telmatobacter bradus]|uniref:ABC transporter permease n=1 Tax=Telmatobacter bradus TaxID=474953 RepID=UPI003B43B6E3
MERLQELLRRVWFWFGADRFNREMEEEMRFHMEQRASQLRAEGASDEEATRAARLRFGNTALLRDRTRAAWGWSVLDRLGQDLRFALRNIRRNRGLSAIVILTLGCGIGVNTAVFSVVHALLVNPYPFPHAERILALDAKHVSGTNEGAGYPQFMDWKRQNTAFNAMAISPEVRQRTLTGIGQPQVVIGSGTTPEFLRVLGIEPQMGRFFTEEEDRLGAPHVLVLSDAAWRKRFAADVHVLGRTVTLDGVAYTIIGVLPRGYSFPGAMTGEFLAPLLETETGTLGRRQHQYGVVARLKEGVTLAEAQNQMSMIAQRLEAQYPETDKGWRVQVQTMGAWLAGEVSKPLAIFAVAACCVLLLASVSVAGLLLARASDRTQEMAIRASLGAGRARLLRQMLTETVLLSVSGGALGIVLVLTLMRVFRVIAPSELGFAVSLQLNGMVLLFTVVLSLMTGLLTGLIPALAVTGANPNAVLRSSGGAGLSGAWSSLRARNRTMNWLVAGEVALAVLMLAAAGLLVKSFVLLIPA